MYNIYITLSYSTGASDQKSHQAYRIVAIVQNAPMKPKSGFFESQSFTRGGPA